jgi:hypothetical protein
MRSKMPTKNPFEMPPSTMFDVCPERVEVSLPGRKNPGTAADQ